ncbi:hypothetical protein HMPREF0765_2688 [Sphingobacterium spiritivorum ATCC 33300]|uniref:Uncharacterized protein n=1 Tax=Sphingobacterium spiritivorum ATCC 33300 TaxID=525372 RepID=C2FZD2_SPHSI|nr:hypothetical protein HMPREF0765_2688 [Sphingobacterium spiritivorum ATCC 33300]
MQTDRKYMLRQKGIIVSQEQKYANKVQIIVKAKIFIKTNPVYYNFRNFRVQ